MKLATPTAALAVSILAAAFPHAEAQAAGASSKAQSSCFYVSQIEDSQPLGDRSVLFRVNVSDYYRLDFANRCVMLTFPDPKLIIKPFGGNDLICHAIDVDISVSDQGPGAIPEPCIPSSLHRLSPAEVAAIPKKNLP